MISPRTPNYRPLFKEFDRVWPWLEASLAEWYGPTHGKRDVYLRILECRAYLFPGINCAIVGEIISYPTGLRAFNYWLQGGNLDELKSMHAGIEEWAVKMKDCKLAMGMGRVGWQKVMEGDWQRGPMRRWKWLKQVTPPAGPLVPPSGASIGTGAENILIER